MQDFYEISDRYIAAGDADVLLYEPLRAGLTFRCTRLYEFILAVEAPEGALQRFVEATLLDDISQELHPLPSASEPALDGYSFVLDYGMKPGALDLEKEAILSYYRGMSSPGFELADLKIRQRLYLFGAEAATAAQTAESFVKDLCNPAIHHWSVIQADV